MILILVIVPVKPKYVYGREYKYPVCCIIAYYIHYLYYPLQVFIAKKRGIITCIEHDLDPQIKCPYHYIKSVHSKQAHIKRYRILED